MSNEEKANDIQPGDEIAFLLAQTKTFGTVTDVLPQGVHVLLPGHIPFFARWGKITERHRVIPGEGTSSRYYS